MPHLQPRVQPAFQYALVSLSTSFGRQYAVTVVPCLWSFCAYHTHSFRSRKYMSLLTIRLSSPVPKKTNRRKTCIIVSRGNRLLLFCIAVPASVPYVLTTDRAYRPCYQ